jgi:hypothetical protein
MSTSKVTADLKARTFSIEVPDEKLDAVFDRLQHLFSLAATSVEAPSEEDFEAGGAGDQSATSEQKGKEIPADQKGRRRTRSGSGGKHKTLSLVDLGLTEDQRTILRTFFKEKQPNGQKQELAVLGVKLAEFLERKSLTADEVHSALKIVDRPTPRNLSAVFGNMKKDGMGDYKDNDLIVNHYTEDYVKFKLPATNPKKDQ